MFNATYTTIALAATCKYHHAGALLPLLVIVVPESVALSALVGSESMLQTDQAV